MGKLSDAAQGAWVMEAIKETLTRELAAREVMTMTILAENFDFTEEQLNKYADLKMKKMREAREAQTIKD
jgi:hypothetical protein